jgi:predicted RNase H-like HicB family nuclease
MKLGGESIKRFFTLEYWMDDGWFLGKLREIPEFFNQGEALEELKANIADACRMMLKSESESEHANSRTLELRVEL